MGKVLSFISSFCDRNTKSIPWILAGIAILATLPSLWTGFCTDDRLFQVVFRHASPYPELERGSLDLFAFSGHSKEDIHLYMDRGLLPWWTSGQWKIAFWRPLSAFTHWLDWQVFGERPFLMHMESLAWYGLLTAAVALVYLRFLEPPWVAALAGLFYALDAAHGMGAGWLAGRNGMLSAICVVLVLYCHDRWRRDDWKPGMPLAWVFLVLGLLCGEAAVAAGGYLAAHALFLDRGRLHIRFMRLVPYLLIVIVWRTVYHHLGYGVAASIFYVDPVCEPLQFAQRLPWRLAMLLFAQLAGGECGICNYIPPAWAWIAFAVAAAFLAWVAYVVWPLLRRDPVARFWAVGMVLAAIPSCAVIPQSRLLFCAGIGGMALVARFLHSWTQRDQGSVCRTADPRRYRLAAKTLVVVWVAFRLCVSAALLPVACYSTCFVDRAAQQEVRCIPNTPELRNQTLVVVNAMIDLWGSFANVLRVAEGLPCPAACRLLAAGTRDLEVTRTDAHTLLLKIDNNFLDNQWTTAFRNPAVDPMYPGQTVNIKGMQAKVESVTPAGAPCEVSFRFDVPLEDPSLCWIAYDRGKYGAFVPPGIGETRHVSSPDFADVARSFLGLAKTTD